MRGSLAGSALIVSLVAAASSRWGGALGDRQPGWPPTFKLAVLSRSVNGDEADGLLIEVRSRAKYPATVLVWAESQSQTKDPQELEVALAPGESRAVRLGLGSASSRQALTLSVREWVSSFDSTAFDPNRIAPVWKCGLAAGTDLMCKP